MGGTGDRDDLNLPPATVAAVQRSLRRLPPGARVLLGVSGGPDSVGMARLVTAARPDLSAGVVHVRHGLRDDAADAQAAVAAARALDLGWRVISVAVATTGTGPEDAARRQRLAAVARAARDAGACAVLLAHTADDQAETVLLHIARGAGLGGLSGIPRWRPLTDGVLVGRPLLSLRRADVRTVAQRAGLPFVHDPTNDDPQQRRSRARHELLPQLAALTGGGTDPVLALSRLAQHARRDAAALDAMAARRFRRLVQRWGPVATLPTDDVDALPGALGTRVVRHLISSGVYGASEASVAAVRRLRDGQALTLPGGALCSRGGGYLAVTPAGTAPLPERTGMGRVELPEIDAWLVRGNRPPARSVLPPWAPSRAAAFVSCTADGTLCVRARRPGDRIRTAGGTQTVAAAMAAAAVPRVARELVPVVEDADGIVWVPGVAVRAGLAGDAYLGLVAAK